MNSLDQIVSGLSLWIFVSPQKCVSYLLVSINIDILNFFYVCFMYFVWSLKNQKVVISISLSILPNTDGSIQGDMFKSSWNSINNTNHSSWRNETRLKPVLDKSHDRTLLINVIWFKSFFVLFQMYYNCLWQYLHWSWIKQHWNRRKVNFWLKQVVTLRRHHSDPLCFLKMPPGPCLHGNHYGEWGLSIWGKMSRPSTWVMEGNRCGVGVDLGDGGTASG